MRSPSSQASRSHRPPARSRGFVLAGLIALLGAVLPAATATPALASHLGAASSVTIAGSLQSELGCPGDWQPECAATHLAFDTIDAIWQGSLAVPAGAWAYKAALNDAWAESYGPTPAPPTSRSPLCRDSAGRSSTTTTERTGSPATGTRSSRRWPGASRASSAARVTGSRTACARGCRTRTATAPTPSHRRAAGRRLRVQGRAQRGVGRQLPGATTSPFAVDNARRHRSPFTLYRRRTNAVTVDGRSRRHRPIPPMRPSPATASART